MNRLKLLVASLSIGLGLLVSTPLASAAFDPLKTTCDQVSANGASSSLCSPSQKPTENPVSGKNGIISKAANIVAIVAAAGAMINIFIGAFEFVTAGGTGFKSQIAGAAPTKAAKARSRVASGFIGLVIVALAWSIVRFITDKVLQ